jgi:very-short-patch-repair endonuclease
MTDQYIPMFTLREVEEAIETLKRLDPKVSQIILDRVGDAIDGQMQVIEDCESPIEQLMALVLEGLPKQFEGKHDDCYVVINPQYEITVGDKRYRADFMIGCLIKGTPYSVIVECDGHAFHEKTKKQAARDKARDRALQSSGSYVLRFTGSEIWNDPFGCARQVFETIEGIAGLKES